MKSLKKIVSKNSVKDLREKALTAEKIYLMNYLVNLRAKRVLKVIESEKGALDNKVKRQCDEYAKDYLNNIKFSPWLYVYSAIQGEFKEGWIPLNYHLEHFVNGLDSIFSSQGDMKPLTAKLLDTNKIPDLVYVHNGLFVEPNNMSILTEEAAYQLLFKENDSVIFKSNKSIRGRGIYFYNKQNFNINEVKNKSGVFQKIIDQHEFFNDILPVPGATIRIVTALDNTGKASVRSAYLRLARLTDKSTHIQATSNLRVAIDIKSGSLSTLAYLPDWSTINSHPDTSVAFSNLVIPEFLKACTEVESLHNRFPFISMIGWDVSINSNNDVEIMEWNTGTNAIDFHEAMHGPCFTDLLNRQINLK